MGLSTQRTDKPKGSRGLTLKEMSLFSMFGALIFISKLVMEFMPNIHAIAMLIISFTVVYRQKALYIIYIFVFLTGLYFGFQIWWIPYLYIWTVLWGVTMLLPKRMPLALQPFVYCAVAALHGISYGTLYSPFQMIAYNLTFRKTLLWIAAGFFPWDVRHAIGNAVIGLLIVPTIALLRKLNKTYGH